MADEIVIKIDSDSEIYQLDSFVSIEAVEENKKIVVFDDVIEITRENTDSSIFLEFNPAIIHLYEKGPKGDKGDAGIGGGISGSLPSGLVSASVQINFIEISNKPSLYSSSAQVDYNSISGVPSGILSSSDLFILSTQTSSFLNNSFTQSYYLFSSSISSRTFGVESQTGSFALKSEISGSYISSSNALSGRLNYLETKALVSGSSQIIYSNIFGIPSNLISSSAQIDYQLIPSRPAVIFSSSAQINYPQISNIPIGILSSSNGFVSSSEQVDYNLIQNRPSLIPSSSYSVTASYALSSTGIVEESDPIFLSRSSSLATTGSNIFIGVQTITGSIHSTGGFFGDGSNLYNIISSSYSSFSPYIQTIGVRIKTSDTYISAGSKGYRHIANNSRISKIRGYANVLGSIHLNIRKNGVVLGNYSLINSSASIDTTLLGWSTQLLQDDLLEFYVSGSSIYITDFNFYMDIQNI